jgi:predicted DNA-binding transcriptional regulator AlpA
MEQKYLTARQVQQMLGCGRSWLYAAMRAGIIPVVELSPRCLRIPADGLDAWLRSRTKNPSAW